MPDVNKVVFGGKTLIDLTNDTIGSEAMLSGYTAHKADGSTVVGRLFEGLPERQSVYIPIRDADGDGLTDSSGELILGGALYAKF